MSSNRTSHILTRKRTAAYEGNLLFFLRCAHESADIFIGLIRGTHVQDVELASRGISPNPASLDFFLSILWIDGAHTDHDFRGVSHQTGGAARVPCRLAHYGQGRSARRCLHEKSRPARSSINLQHALEYRRLLCSRTNSSSIGVGTHAHTSPPRRVCRSKPSGPPRNGKAELLGHHAFGTCPDFRLLHRSRVDPLYRIRPFYGDVLRAASSAERRGGHPPGLMMQNRANSTGTVIATALVDSRQALQSRISTL